MGKIPRHLLVAYEAEILHSDRFYYKTEGKVSKTKHFCQGAEPGAPDAGR
jgi:hypothetical protein